MWMADHAIHIHIVGMINTIMIRMVIGRDVASLADADPGRSVKGEVARFAVKDGRFNGVRIILAYLASDKGKVGGRGSVMRIRCLAI